MGVQLPNIPALSSKVDSEVRRAFDSIKGWLGKVGADGGIITQGSLPSELANTPAIAAIFNGSIPPQLIGLTASGGFASIMVSWDAPLFSNLSYVEVWRCTTDDIGSAQLIGTTTSTQYPDTPAASPDDVARQCLSTDGPHASHDSDGFSGQREDDAAQSHPA